MTFPGGEHIKFSIFTPENRNINEITLRIKFASTTAGIVFALHRKIEGQITQVQVTRDALGAIYITFTEECKEVIPEPKTGKSRRVLIWVSKTS